jgi:hypothetical protein
VHVGRGFEGARLPAAPSAPQNQLRTHDLSYPPRVTTVRRCATNEPLLNDAPWRILVPVENMFRSLAGRRKHMTEFLRKNGRLADIAEYVVMLFVTLMTGVSTLRLLGILP